MPVLVTPAGDRPSATLTVRVGELEANGARIISTQLLAGEWIIVYEVKPKPGRPPKAVTR